MPLAVVHVVLWPRLKRVTTARKVRLFFGVFAVLRVVVSRDPYPLGGMDALPDDLYPYTL